MIDRVLGRYDQKRFFQIVCGSVHRHSAFRHRLQQRRLRTGRGAVDLVGQQDLCKDRSGAEFEFGFLLIENRRARDVGRQQVGRALNAFELTADAFCQRPGQHRLGHAGNVFQQQVPLGKPGDHRQHQLLAFADDGVFDVGDHPFGQLRDSRNVGGFPRDARSRNRFGGWIDDRRGIGHVYRRKSRWDEKNERASERDGQSTSLID